MPWQLHVLIAVFSAAALTLLTKRFLFLKKPDPVLLAAVTQFCVGIILLVIAIILGFPWPSNFFSLIFFVNLSAILYLFGNIYRLKALEKVEASQFALVTQISPIITFILAMLVLGERFRWENLIGMLLIIAGVVIATVHKFELDIRKGTLYAVIFALFFGIAYTSDSYILRSFNVFVYGSIAFLLPAILTFAFYGKSPGLVIKHKGTFLNPLFGLIVVLSAIITINLSRAYQIGRNLAEISPMNHTVTILTVIMAYFFLGEKGNIKRKIIAAVMGLVGVLLIV